MHSPIVIVTTKLQVAMLFDESAYMYITLVSPTPNNPPGEWVLMSKVILSEASSAKGSFQVTWETRVPTSIVALISDGQFRIWGAAVSTVF